MLPSHHATLKQLETKGTLEYDNKIEHEYIISHQQNAYSLRPKKKGTIAPPPPPPPPPPTSTCIPYLREIWSNLSTNYHVVITFSRLYPYNWTLPPTSFRWYKRRNLWQPQKPHALPVEVAESLWDEP